VTLKQGVTDKYRIKGICRQSAQETTKCDENSNESQATTATCNASAACYRTWWPERLANGLRGTALLEDRDARKITLSHFEWHRFSSIRADTERTWFAENWETFTDQWWA